MRRFLLTTTAALAACSSCPENATLAEEADGTRVCVCDDGLADVDGECVAEADTDTDTDADTDTDSDADADTDTDTDTDTDPDALSGTFSYSLSEGTLRMNVATARAFSYLKTDGSTDTLLVYTSSSPDATCETVGDYLANELIDPTSLFRSEYCNLLVRTTTTSGDVSIGLLEPLVQISCVSGGGTWDLTTGEDKKKTQYYAWSGATLSGTVTVGDFVGITDSGSGYSFDFDPDQMSLTYTYGSETSSSDVVVPAFSGTVNAVTCPDMADALIINSGGGPN